MASSWALEYLQMNLCLSVKFLALLTIPFFEKIRFPELDFQLMRKNLGKQVIIMQIKDVI